ncbi:mitochondrial hydrolase YKR070W isoform X4 [Coffea arabica]|uniref:Mitochondrial hydrolase YKR070W isoform X4 n=1 Tax=Coffea arabica TaxID=13443 RepID=A0ABM4VSM9_COFAR
MRFRFQPPIQLSSSGHHLLPLPTPPPFLSSSPSLSTCSISHHHRLMFSTFLLLGTTTPMTLEKTAVNLLSFWNCHSSSSRCTSSFGIAFDIDGVILRGQNPIGNSPAALKRLYHDYSGNLKIPFLFLTNGGGTPESRRAFEMSQLLGVKILPSQVVQGHSCFRSLLKRFKNDFIVATGKGEPELVMSEYGFRNVISLDDYASYFDNIDPVAQYKSWKVKQESNMLPFSMKSIQDVSLDRVKAAFIVSDPVDWGRDIQAAFPSERLGIGAFRIALESVFNRIHDMPLECTVFGKPNPFVFRNAEAILRHIWAFSCHGNAIRPEDEDSSSHSFTTLYMIGDNPLVDIKGALQAGHPWFSILTRTGVFRQTENHAEYPADVVVDTVAEAVDFILERESAP